MMRGQLLGENSFPSAKGRVVGTYVRHRRSRSGRNGHLTTKAVGEVASWAGWDWAGPPRAAAKLVGASRGG